MWVEVLDLACVLVFMLFIHSMVCDVVADTNNCVITLSISRYVYPYELLVRVGYSVRVYFKGASACPLLVHICICTLFLKTTL